MLLIFESKFGIQIVLDNPNLPSPCLFCDFYACSPEEELKVSNFELALPREKRFECVKKVAEICLHLMGKASLGPETKRNLYDLINGADNQRIIQENGFLLKNTVFDKKGLSLSMLMKPPVTDAGFYKKLINEYLKKIKGFRLWSCHTYGNLERVSALRNCTGLFSSKITLGGTEFELLDLELKNYELWKTKLSSRSISVNNAKAIISQYGALKSDELVFKWVNCGGWPVDLQGNYSEPSTDFDEINTLELVISKTGSSKTLFSIGKDLPVNKIKTAIENILEVSLKKCNY